MFCLYRSKFSIDEIAGPEICFYLMDNGLLFYPIFQKYNYDDGEICDCDLNSTAINQNCLSFDIIASMYFHSREMHSDNNAESLNWKTINFARKMHSVITNSGDKEFYSLTHSVSEYFLQFIARPRLLQQLSKYIPCLLPFLLCYFNWNFQWKSCLKQKWRYTRRFELWGGDWWSIVFKDPGESGWDSERE